MNTLCILYVLEVPLIFSMLVLQLLKSNITVDGLLLQRSYTIVIDWVSLVLIVLWLLELEGTGANVIISVGVVVPSPELAGYPPGILYVSGTLVLFEDALLECLEGSRVMGIIIFTYILIHVTFAPSNQSCHTTVCYTAYLGESATPRLILQPTWLYTSEVCSRRSLNIIFSTRRVEKIH